MIFSLKPFLVTLGIVLGLFGTTAYQHSEPVQQAFGAQSALTTFQGGTGSTSPSGILIGDTSIRLKTLTIGSNLSLIGTTLSATGGGADFPYTPTATYNSTSTVIGFLQGLFSNSSTTLNGTVQVPDITDKILSTDSNGKVYGAASTSLDFVDGAGANTRVAFWTDADTLSSDADMTFSTVANRLTVAKLRVLGETVVDTTAGIALSDNAGDFVHHLFVLSAENLSADRNLSIVTGDADRTLTFSGSPTLGDWFDQSVKAAATPTFGGLTLSNITDKILSTDVNGKLYGTATSSFNAGTASALAANAANCSAGSGAGGVDASGAAEDCTDYEQSLTAGDALTRTGDDFDFDGGATPAGDLGNTWADPSVDDDSHAHTATTISGLGTADISGLDISDDTNLTAGDCITLTADDLDVDDCFLLNNGDTGTGLYTFSTGLSSASTTLTGPFIFQNATGTNATTTNFFATVASSTSLYGANLSTCNAGNVLTWAAGKFGCAADQTSAGAANPFTWEENYGVTNAATSSVLWAQSGINASTTSNFVYASTSVLTVANDLYLSKATGSNIRATDFLALRSGDSDDIFLQAGDSTTGNGGGVTIDTGEGFSGGDTDGGFMNITTQDGHGTGHGGDIEIDPGVGQGSGRGGNTVIFGGEAGGDGTGGEVKLIGGGAQGDGNGGAVSIIPGRPHGAGTSGDVRLYKDTAAANYAILNLDSIASTNKTFTFPNLTGTLALLENFQAFTAHKTFTSLFATVASTTNATSTNMTVTGTASTSKLFADGLVTCNTGNMLTWAAGVFGCEDDSTGAGGAFPFTPQTYGNSTTTLIDFKGGIMATGSSTVQQIKIGDATTTNATTTNLSVSGAVDFDLLTSALIVTGAGGILAEYAGAGCTNQVVEDVSAIGGTTCVSIESEQLGDDDWGELTVASGVVTVDDGVIESEHFGDDDWGDITITTNDAAVEDDSHAHTASTISGLGTADISGLDVSDDLNLTAGDNLTLTGDDIDLDAILTSITSIAATAASTTNATFASFFQLPVAASFSNFLRGALYYDTSAGNLLMGTTTATHATDHVVIASATTTLYAFAVSSTTPFHFDSGKFQELPAHPLAQVATHIWCKAIGGTSKVITLSDTGANDANSITCTTTGTQFALTTNNSFNAYEAMRMEMGATTGVVDQVVIRVMGYRTTN